MALQMLDPDPTNREQLRAWDGDEGAYWARRADHFDRALARYHGRFMDTAGIGPGDRVLDIGCGTGQTTRDAARRAPAGSALGVDLSSAMLRVARERARLEGLHRVRFEQADAQVHPFEPASFDIAISRTGSMFFGDPVAAFANIRDSLRRGGRLVLLVWQPASRNEWITEITSALAAGRDLPAPPPDAPGPFSMADPDRVRAVSTAAGFREVVVTGLAEPMWFGRDPEDAFGLLSGLLGWMLRGLDEQASARALANLRRTLATHATGDGVEFGSAAWLVTAGR